MYLISFYVPALQAGQVKAAMFRTGAGKIGNYEQCSFEFLGTGQFMPLKGATPFLGNTDELEKVNEVKVEMVCDKALIKEVIKALRDAHPYETPAYHVLECLDF
jgi:hypothetical protein